jgi:aspartyl-tRNA(Asn)/glutamyl-tRNA(Gln) amidotransferase subunit A
VGLKPTYGRISRWGLVAYASSFDCIGPIANSLADVALLLEIMAGPDGFDSTVSTQPVGAYTQAVTAPVKPLRVAYLREGIDSEGVDPAIREATRQKLDQLRAAGHQVEAVDISLLKYLLPTYYILTTAEASSNLSRFDGVRYGYRSPDSTDLITMYKRSRTEGFGAEVRRRILLGTFVLSASYYDAYYTKAQRVRRLMQQEMERLFARYDVLLSPTTPTTAYRLGEKTSDPLQMYLGDIFTVLANVVGYPAVSIPNGYDGSEPALPIGLQLMTPPFSEERLLTVAQSLQ